MFHLLFHMIHTATCTQQQRVQHSHAPIKTPFALHKTSNAIWNNAVGLKGQGSEAEGFFQKRECMQHRHIEERRVQQCRITPPELHHTFSNAWDVGGHSPDVQQTTST